MDNEKQNVMSWKEWSLWVISTLAVVACSFRYSACAEEKTRLEEEAGVIHAKCECNKVKK